MRPYTIPRCRFGATLLALTLLALLPDTATAQHARTAVEKDDVHVRNDCRLAAQVLETGHPHPKYQWALDQIRVCEQSGGAALAGVWRTAPDDRTELGQLMFVTRALRDQRVFDVTADVAQDDRRPTLIRLAAMSVLTSFADSVIQPRLEVLENPPPLHVLSTRFDLPITPGSVPLAADAPERVMALFAKMATQDRNPMVRAAAQYLHRGLLLHFAP